MKSILVLIGFCSIIFAADLDLVRINVADKVEVKQLDRMGVIINQVHPDHVVAEISKEMYGVLARLGCQVTLVQQNITEVYRQNSLSKSSLSQYLTYQQYCDSMVAIANNHPDICQLDTLGYSHANRLLLVMKVSDSVNIDELEPEVHFEGDIHGDEKIGWAMSFCMLKYLVENYPTDTVVQQLVDNLEIWIAPTVNPDGFVANSRYNNRSVDINRNWGWMWGNEYAAGSDFFSENESWRLLEHFWRHPFVTYVSFHAGTMCISEPWSYTTYVAPPEQNLLHHLSQGYASFTTYPYGQGSIVMYEINGCTKDYDYGCGGEMGWSIEVCDLKTPPADSIDVIFAREGPAMMWLMHKASQGIHGVVYDSLSVEPNKLRALVLVSPSNWPSYSSDINGDFHRFYLPGTYDVTVLCPGYEPKTVNDVVVPAGTPDSSVSLEFGMIPNTDLPVYATNVVGARYVSTASNLTYPVRALGPHDNQAFQLDANKWLVLRLDYPIHDLSGNDLTVYRSTGSGVATIKVSNDWRGSWQTVGTANAAISSFDISTTALDSAFYVRIEASSQFMIDAVEAPQPGTGVVDDNNAGDVDRVVFGITPTVLRKGQMLNVDNPYPLEIHVFNLLGQEVATLNVEHDQKQVSLPGLSSGVYFLTVSDVKSARRIVLVD